MNFSNGIGLILRRGSFMGIFLPTLNMFSGKTKPLPRGKAGALAGGLSDSMEKQAAAIQISRLLKGAQRKLREKRAVSLCRLQQGDPAGTRQKAAATRIFHLLTGAQRKLIEKQAEVNQIARLLEVARRKSIEKQAEVNQIAYLLEGARRRSREKRAAVPNVFRTPFLSMLRSAAGKGTRAAVKGLQQQFDKGYKMEGQIRNPSSGLWKSLMSFKPQQAGGKTLNELTQQARQSPLNPRAVLAKATPEELKSFPAFSDYTPAGNIAWQLPHVGFTGHPADITKMVQLSSGLPDVEEGNLFFRALKAVLEEGRLYSRENEAVPFFVQRVLAGKNLLPPQLPIPGRLKAPPQALGFYNPQTGYIGLPQYPVDYPKTIPKFPAYADKLPALVKNRELASEYVSRTPGQFLSTVAHETGHGMQIPVAESISDYGRPTAQVRELIDSQRVLQNPLSELTADYNAYGLLNRLADKGPNKKWWESAIDDRYSQAQFNPNSPRSLKEPMAGVLRSPAVPAEARAEALGQLEYLAEHGGVTGHKMDYSRNMAADPQTDLDNFWKGMRQKLNFEPDSWGL
jgi:hypothetical protein